LRIKEAAPALGAYISNFSIKEISDSLDARNEISALLSKYGVLFFRDQRVTAYELSEFAKYFGKIEGHPAYPTVQGVPEVQILESTKDRPSKIELWHSDMSFRPNPPIITILHAQILPREGGDTLWASAEAAYESLDAYTKKRIEHLVAVHEFEYGFRESINEPGGAERLALAISQHPAVEHSVVKKHPVTGRKLLFVNPLFTSKLLGNDATASRALLKELCARIVSDDFVVRLKWEVNTVAMWDNRSTQHKPVNDFFPEHRKMHRITVGL
tara:strand:- start:135 stop:947 length:813 start_codon:yes stop_codon:yes gene_type:complete